jgi:hypothetical protein
MWEGVEPAAAGSESNTTDSCKCHTYFASFFIKKLIAKLLKSFVGYVQCSPLIRAFSHPLRVEKYAIT